MKEEETCEELKKEVLEQPNKDEKQGLEPNKKCKKHGTQKDKSNKDQKTRKVKGKPGFNENMFQETSYYFKDGLRWVFPYPFTFTAYAKQRWFNLTVLELFSKEFHLETLDYYRRAITSGKIKVNGQPVTADQKLKNQDVLKTMVHRHEPPVAHHNIEFLRNDDEMVVINKPPSIPVHPCGRYRHNSIVFILGKEHNLHRLHTIHRIDRLTSGVLMFAKVVSKAKEIEDQLHKKQCIEKEYLARVVGEFPEDETIVKEPVTTASHKIGVCHVHAEGKPCLTKFKRLSFNGKSSVVSCKPLQGRMHQIRVHLQWLGHPIVNDPIYNHPTAWGTKKRKHAIDEVILELIRTRKDKSYDEELSTDKPPDIGSHPKRRKIDNVENANAKNMTEELGYGEHGTVVMGQKCDSTERELTSTNECSEIVNDTRLQTEDGDGNDNATEGTEPIQEEEEGEGEEEDGRLSYTSLDIGEEYVDADCSDCKRTWKQPLLSEMVMYLHSLHYKGPDWEYKTSLPEWAKENWDVD